MRKRLLILFGAGLLLSGALQLWIQFPNKFSNYVTRWEVARHKRATGMSAPVPVDMSPNVWPRAAGIVLVASGAGLLFLGLHGRPPNVRRPPPDRPAAS